MSIKSLSQNVSMRLARWATDTDHADQLGQVALSLWSTLAGWQDRGLQRHKLRGLDDRMLKDIGRSRADADHEANKPFWR